MGYPEDQDIRTGKAPKHQAAAEKGKIDISNAEIIPLVEDNEYSPKKMKGSLAMIDPIKQILDIRTKYETKHAFLREALQNVDRSSSEEGHNLDPDVDIVITEDSLMIQDNAGGITKEHLSKLFDFGVSGWEGGAIKENPFGQGFLSFVILFNRVEVLSNNVHAIFDLGKIVKSREEKVFNLNEAYDYETTRSHDTFGKGEFTLICSDPTEHWDVDLASDMVVLSGSSLSFRSLTLNGISIELESFDAPHGTIDISKYNSDGEKVIDGWVNPTGNMGQYPNIYHHRKIVGHFYSLPGVDGKINVLDNRYGEPVENRDRWQESTKGRGIGLTKKHVKEHIKKFILNIYQYGSNEMIQQFEGFRTMGNYIDYKDYRYLINFNIIGNNTTKAIAEDIRRKNPDITEEGFNEEIQERMGSKSKLTEAAASTIRSADEIAEDYNEKEKDIQKRKEEIAEEHADADRVEKEILEEKEEALTQEESELVKREEKRIKDEEERAKRVREGTIKLADINKVTFWVRVAEIPAALEQIKNAEYHGYQIAIAYNRVQEEVFENESINKQNDDDSYYSGRIKKTKSKNIFLHIGHFKYVSTNTVKMKKIGPKNKEEARIEWVVNTFINSIPEFEQVNFHIADYDFMTIMKIPGTNIKETRKTCAVAYAHGNDVYMMREIGYGNSDAGELQGFYGAKSLKPYLKYNNFPLENKTIGWGDIALFLRVLNLIAHEMAHSIYHTIDNTQEHFEAMGDIIAKFNAVITEHQGRTTLGNAKDIGVKNRRALGVEKGDTVAITYFTGTDIEMEESEIKPQSVKKTKSFKAWDYLLHNESSAYIESVGVDSYTVRYLVNPDGESKSFEILKSEAVEYPFKKGKLYKDPENDDTYFIMDVTYTPWDRYDNGIKFFKFMGFNDIDVKNEEFLSTQQAITIGLVQYNKKEQAEFVHNIALKLIDKRMESYGYVSIPYLVDYFQPILPINFQTIQYIIKDKYPDKYEKVGLLTYDGAEQYYFK